MLEVWDTSNRYHIFHSLALLFVPQTLVGKSTKSSYAGQFFSAGILIFSGSLYAMVLSGNRKLGAITPIGGLFLIGGWLALGFGW
mmetsp:Transcript_6342/g.9898  ORF Transcript_6342/g.9898 Transcript_6342/m.9898 type:complete len:85 (+) Transcript_6342:273-527(+)